MKKQYRIVSKGGPFLVLLILIFQKPWFMHILQRMTATASKTISSLKISAVMLLVIIYALGALRPESLHRLFHSHQNIEQHFAENEKDPCHRSIYHGGVTGCKHKAHVLQTSKCNYCDITSFTGHILVPDPETNYTRAIPAVFRYFDPHFSVAVTLNLSARAPPVA
jgi:hypothetical protein